MVSAISQLAGAPLANMLVIAGLACIAIAIFGWARETIAASAGFRAVSGLTGVLLLFCVYGIYLPRASHWQDAEATQTAETRTAQTQQAVASRQAQQPANSTRPATQSSPSSAQPLASQQQATPTTQQQQSAQPSAPQAPAESLFSGRWKNADPKTASVLLLRVEEHDGAVTVRAWGMCLPQQANRGLLSQRANSGRAGDPIAANSAAQYCDWGTEHGVVRDGAATVIWQQGTVLRRMKLLPDGESLRVVLDSAYRGRPSQHTEAHFAKSL